MADESFKVKALEIAFTVAKLELVAFHTNPEPLATTLVKGETPEERRAFADKLIGRTRELLDALVVSGKRA